MRVDVVYLDESISGESRRNMRKVVLLIAFTASGVSSFFQASSFFTSPPTENGETADNCTFVLLKGRFDSSRPIIENIDMHVVEEILGPYSSEKIKN